MLLGYTEIIEFFCTEPCDLLGHKPPRIGHFLEMQKRKKRNLCWLRFLIYTRAYNNNNTIRVDANSICGNLIFLNWWYIRFFEAILFVIVFNEWYFYLHFGHPIQCQRSHIMSMYVFFPSFFGAPLPFEISCTWSIPKHALVWVYYNKKKWFIRSVRDFPFHINKFDVV